MSEQPNTETQDSAAQAPDSAADQTESANEDAYNGEFRPAKDRTEQSPEDLALAAEVEEAMRDVVDPELGVNVVDLGLVYDIWIHDGRTARIDMTLTSAACPLTDVIEDQAETEVVGSGIADKLELNWVWMPPWGPDKITEEGREQLRALGFTI